MTNPGSDPELEAKATETESTKGHITPLVFIFVPIALALASALFQP
jgi:hypothetical protein